MYKIVDKRRLADSIDLCEVYAPRVAHKCEPGQFVMVRIDEFGERIPLTICDYDRTKGTITIVYQAVGVSTKMMQDLSAGDSFKDVAGPLGQPSELIHTPLDELKQKKILFVAGGVGCAPVYPPVKWMKAH